MFFSTRKLKAGGEIEKDLMATSTTDRVHQLLPAGIILFVFVWLYNYPFYLLDFFVNNSLLQIQKSKEGNRQLVFLLHFYSFYLNSMWFDFLHSNSNWDLIFSVHFLIFFLIWSWFEGMSPVNGNGEEPVVQINIDNDRKEERGKPKAESWIEFVDVGNRPSTPQAL